LQRAIFNSANFDRGLKAGFFRYITKPIKVNEFMEAMDLALEYPQNAVRVA
jgi:DNA-binding response OmpR family regulator